VKPSDAGLTIATRLIELMGGNLTIDRIPAQGSSARFTIRVAVGLQSAHNQTDEFNGLEGSSVIVAVKTAHTARVLEAYLRGWKLTPLLAASGKEAIDLLANKPAALCITDLNLVDMTGAELVEALKAKQAGLPAILLTAEGMYSGKQPELFSSVLFKPLKRDLLEKHILSPLKHRDETSASALSKTSRLSENFSTLHPLRILVAEDNLTNQKLALKVLAKLGFTPDIANHGKEVLEMVSHKAYDLILMDVQMPFMDGLEASRMIRLCLSTQPVIVAMTANTLQGDREECIRAGMDDYLSKPVKFEELVGILEKWAARIEAK
jgi:CheY-like chemotaxis protein